MKYNFWGLDKLELILSPIPISEMIITKNTFNTILSFENGRFIKRRSFSYIFYTHLFFIQILYNVIIVNVGKWKVYAVFGMREIFARLRKIFYSFRWSNSSHFEGCIEKHLVTNVQVVISICWVHVSPREKSIHISRDPTVRHGFFSFIIKNEGLGPLYPHKNF